MVRSQTNTARVEGLRPGIMYMVQVRARTVAGFGKYSSKQCFQTLTDGMLRVCVCVTAMRVFVSVDSVWEIGYSNNFKH